MNDVLLAIYPKISNLALNIAVKYNTSYTIFPRPAMYAALLDSNHPDYVADHTYVNQIRVNWSVIPPDRSSSETPSTEHIGGLHALIYSLTLHENHIRFWIDDILVDEYEWTDPKLLYKIEKIFH